MPAAITKNIRNSHWNAVGESLLLMRRPIRVQMTSAGSVEMKLWSVCVVNALL